MTRETLYATPYAPGDSWPGGDPPHKEPSPETDAYFVPAGLWVRANSPEEANEIALAMIQTQVDVDSGEAGHIRMGYLLRAKYHTV